MAFKVLTKTLSGTGAQSLLGTAGAVAPTGLGTHIPARWVRIFNVTGNGTLTVGDKNLTATQYGFTIAAAASSDIYPGDGALSMNLEDIWLSGTDTNVIRVTYVT